MPFSYFSKLKGSFRQRIQQSYVVLEGSFVESLEVLPVHGKLLFHKPGVYYRTFAAFCDLNLISQRGTPVAAQSNLKSASQRKNLSVIGAVSRTLSIPSVSGPPFQVCGYHVDHMLTGHHKLPMTLSGSNASLGRFFLNNSTARHMHLFASNGDTNISDVRRRFLSGCQISMRNKEQLDVSFPYGYFICSERESFHSSPACFSASTAADVSFDNSASVNQVASSTDSNNRTILDGGRPLKLVSGSCYLPHPDKEETGGEDAHFICSDKRAIGVADGVGGWVDLGIDAGIYARELMYNSLNAVLDEPTDSTDPAQVLEKAHSNTKSKGSSTACIIALTHQGLSAINLGDSGFMVVRNGCTVFRSPAQQHNFNFTYQLENGSNGDLPSSGQVFSIPVAPGDVIVAGTDGLFDNLYNNDITAVVVHAIRAGLGPQVMAQKIAALARQRAQDKDRPTPFSAAAQEAGFRYYGGKLDDITVVVSYITASNNDEDTSSSSA
ncbi:hypothetical protein M8C21_003400 [Ambrosia artemisiifolia]|uniref:Protein phosphatase n=1 Tax=Ambrosia artemisiifolia TaxID=4212 RepID=A0AAD5GAC7_AMBAR|nr:hypothetical protein M8C21_003400 [Ambrosia artemisiifolia]